MTKGVKNTWLTFEHVGDSKSGKTRIIAVRADHVTGQVGQIRWWGRWRKYVFVPFTDMFFDHDCLREIADECERMTSVHRGGNLKADEGSQ